MPQTRKWRHFLPRQRLKCGIQCRCKLSQDRDNFKKIMKILNFKFLLKWLKINVWKIISACANALKNAKFQRIFKFTLKFAKKTYSAASLSNHTKKKVFLSFKFLNFSQTNFCRQSLPKMKALEDENHNNSS